MHTREVTAGVTANSVGFKSGPTEMKPEGRIILTGDAAGATYCGDREYTAPFALPGIKQWTGPSMGQKKGMKRPVAPNFSGERKIP